MRACGCNTHVYCWGNGARHFSSLAVIFCISSSAFNYKYNYHISYRVDLFDFKSKFACTIRRGNFIIALRDAKIQPFNYEMPRYNRSTMTLVKRSCMLILHLLLGAHDVSLLVSIQRSECEQDISLHEFTWWRYLLCIPWTTHTCFYYHGESHWCYYNRNNYIHTIIKII